MKTYPIKPGKYYFFFFCLNIMMLLSCKKNWLDAKADKSLAVPATLTDFQGLLDNFSTMNGSYPVIGEIASDGHYVADAVYQSATKNANYDAYTWSKTVPHTAANAFWSQSYTKIAYDNVVLDGLAKINPSSLDIEQWKSIKGQALFNRARIFFELAQHYTPPYLSSTANSDLGIVLRLSSDITIPSKRSSVAETYNQILKDLNEAKDLLPIRATMLNRGSGLAANALLARVYLSMEDYEKAFLVADYCLKQYSELLNYNDILPTVAFIPRDNKEVIFQSQFSTGFITSNCLIDRSLYDSYSNNDLRKTRFYKINTDNTISFKGSYENITVQRFNGFTTAEMYLTRAECYARAGKATEAVKDLNDLMIKRWDKNVTYSPITATNPDEALTKILEERKKELILRGIRWMDLRRLNKDPRFAVTLKRTVLGTEYTLEPNSYKYAFPIPDDVIEQTEIQQNPGWP